MLDASPLMTEPRVIRLAAVSLSTVFFECLAAAQPLSVNLWSGEKHVAARSSRQILARIGTWAGQ